MYACKFEPRKVKNNLKNPQLNVENDIGWLFGLQVLLRKSQKCKNKFSQKMFRETLMMLDTDPILAYGLVARSGHTRTGLPGRCPRPTQQPI